MSWIQRLYRYVRVGFRKITYGIQNRIFYPFAVFYVVLVVAMALVAIFYVNDVARKENEESLMSLAKQMAGSFDNYVDSLKDGLAGLVSSGASTVPHIVNRTYRTDTERYSAYYSFYTSATALLNVESFVTNQIYLVNPDDRYILSNSAYFYMDRNYPLEWVERISSGPTYLYHYLLDFQGPKPMQDPYCFAVAINAAGFSQGYMAKDAFLVMIVGQSRMRYAIRQLDDMPFASLVILNDSGEVVYHHRSLREDRAFIQTLQEGVGGDVTIDGAPYRIYTSASTNTQWQLHFLYDKTILAERSNQVARYAVYMASVALLVLLAITYFIAQSISRPVKRMSALMDEIGRGNLDVSLDHVTNDEIGRLSQHFNTMASKMNTLINQVYQTEILHRDAEIRALQQQINPHFIYNTLEIINALTNRQDPEGVKQVTQKMASIFRYGARDGGDMVIIRAELQYTNDYIAIQLIRFQNELIFEVQVDDGLLDCLMPKFLLQPVVENCFVHGFHRREGFVPHIRLDGHRDGDSVLFTICDNGSGIAPARLEKLARDLEHATDRTGRAFEIPASGQEDSFWSGDASIGLQNVHARIRMKYGQPYGVRVESEPGQGATVYLRIPYLQGGKNECLHF